MRRPTRNHARLASGVAGKLTVARIEAPVDHDGGLGVDSRTRGPQGIEISRQYSLVNTAVAMQDKNNNRQKKEVEYVYSSSVAPATLLTGLIMSCFYPKDARVKTKLSTMRVRQARALSASPQASDDGARAGYHPSSIWKVSCRVYLHKEVSIVRLIFRLLNGCKDGDHQETQYWI